MPRLRALRTTGTACLLAVTALVLSACSSHSVDKSTNTTATNSKAGGGSGGRVVDIYSSLPLQGSSASQTVPLVNGIKLALAQAGGRAGQFTVNYQSLDDSTAPTGEWDPTRTEANAQKAAADPNAVYYIGEFNSEASEVSIPILNQAGIAQVSPANTYVGLTEAIPGVSAPDEPQRYYPTGHQNYLRIVPVDSVQAAAELLAEKQAGCTRVAVANDREAYGEGLATLLGDQAKGYGIEIVSNTGIDLKAPSFRSYAATIKRQGANCFEFAGSVAHGGVQITKDVGAALPKAKIFGPDRICNSSWTNARNGGVPASIDPRIECTAPTLGLAAYPGGKQFLSAYEAKYGGGAPDPYAIYGYEAMKLGLDTIAGLGANGNNRADVVKALFAVKNRSSVLGTYGFEKSGDTTLKSYGLYKVGSNGDPVFDRTLTPTKIVS